MESQLKSPKFSEAILDSLYDGVYVVDPERRITFWNKAAERITGFSKSEVQGTRCSDNLLRHVDEQGRPLCDEACPLHYTLQDGQMRSAAVYLHHKLGHRLPVAVGVAPIIDDQGNTLGAVEIFRDNSATISALEQLRGLEDLAYLDELTRLANRRYLEIFFEAKFNELARFGWPFGVIFADLDYFKKINDTHGHQVGGRGPKDGGENLVKKLPLF